MLGQRLFVREVQRTGLVLGGLLIAMAVRPVMAEDLFRFADDASLTSSMAKLDEALAHDAAPLDPCRLDILSDSRGHQLFDEQTSRSMHRALAAGIVGSDRVGGCTVGSHDIGQDEIPGFLEERRKTGELGQTLALSYYKLSEGVTVFATLRAADGALLASTGRFDLPVTLTGLDESESAASNETRTAKNGASTTVPAQTASPAEPAPRVKPDVVIPAPRPLATNGNATPSSVNEALLTEAALRRQLVAETRTSVSPDKPFNLRRIQAGVPSSIKRLRIVDASGQDSSLVANLADDFLDTLATSPASSVETTDISRNGRRGTKVTLDDQPDAAIEAIDIENADTGTAFEDILDNDGDIVVVREPISPADASRFTRAYGVNMRSRYAEHVVAIAKREAGSLACGIRYPEDGMLMSTEDHPTSERVYFYVNPSIPNAIRDQFVDFVLSERGQAVVAAHAVDLRLRLSDAGYATWRHQATSEQDAELFELRERFRSLIRTSQRVSSTFRFDFASADLVLDSRSEQDLENLIDLIKAKDIDSRRILLFGFADSAGTASFNADLSRGRADAVATRLRLAGIPVPPRNVHGIGEDSPVACNFQDDGERDELGARKNRRVEVWIES